MINVTSVLIPAFRRRLRKAYRAMYGGLKHDFEEIIDWVGRMALETIANSDALYHNVEHTVLVTLVGQEILAGKHMREGGVHSEDWLHFVLSLLCHDIGFVKGVCCGDRPEEGRFAAGAAGETVSLPPAATDASLAPYHVDRGKLFVRERFGHHALIDAERIARNIELTRFPVPAAEDYQDTVDYPGLVRAGDLIGQLADPAYLRKLPALYCEFEETGVNRTLGYRSPDDLRHNYPRFYWNAVAPYVKEALRYLALTHKGKQVLANLYSHVFVVEHERPRSDRSPKGPVPAGRLLRDECSSGRQPSDILTLPVQQLEAP